jgi:hypothetical protein
MCSEYNGIQVFLFPGTLFFLLSSDSLVGSFTSLLSLRMHFLPLVFFTVLLAYVCFMGLKIYTSLFDGPHSLYPGKMDEFYDYLIRLHLTLFITVIVLMVFYVLSRFMSYFYGIELPLKKAVWFTFRAFTVLLIAVYYFRSTWLATLMKQRMSISRSKRYWLAWSSRHPFVFLKYSALIIVVMVAAVRLYQLSIVLFISPVLSFIGTLSGLNPGIELIPVSGMFSVFYNVFMLFSAFLLSNLFFYPIIYLAQNLVESLHPIQIKQVDHAQS